MGAAEDLEKLTNKIAERLSRIAHPRTKTASDFIIGHFQTKQLMVQKNKTKISVKDIIEEGKYIVKGAKKIMQV